MALIDPKNGRLRVRLDRHDHAVMSARFSADGTRVVTSSLDHTVSVWDARVSDRFHVDPSNKGPGMHSFMPTPQYDELRRRAVQAHRNNTASVVTIEPPA